VKEVRYLKNNNEILASKWLRKLCKSPRKFNVIILFVFLYNVQCLITTAKCVVSEIVRRWETSSTRTSHSSKVASCSCQVDCALDSTVAT